MLLRSPSTPQGIREWQEKLQTKRARVMDRLAQEAADINAAKLGAMQTRIAMIADLEKEIDELRVL